MSGLCGAKAPHATSLFLFYFIYIIKKVIVISVSECVINSHNSLSVF